MTQKIDSALSNIYEWNLVHDRQYALLKKTVIKLSERIAGIGRIYDNSMRNFAWGTVGTAGSLASGSLMYGLTTNCWSSSAGLAHLTCWANHVFNGSEGVPVWNRSLNAVPWITAAVSVFFLAQGIAGCLSNSRSIATTNQMLKVVTHRLSVAEAATRAAEAAALARERALEDRLKAQQRSYAENTALGFGTLGAAAGAGFWLGGPVGSVVGISIASIIAFINSQPSNS